MNRKFEILIAYIAARAKEQNTWKGCGFILAFIGTRYGVNIDPAMCVFWGGMASAVIGILMPDAKTKADLIIQNIHPEVQAALAEKETT